MRILIAGCDDVGEALGAGVATGGHEVWGLRRDPSDLLAALRALRADRATHVEGLCALLQALAAQRQAPHRIAFTSSTAVDGQTDGSWVDQAYSTEPGGFRARRLLQAEVELHGLARRTGPATARRPGGHGGSERGRER